MEAFEIKQKEAEEREHLQNSYKQKFADIFFSQCVSNLNRVVGLLPGSQFSLGLFLKLDVNFEPIWLPEKKKFRVPKDLDYKNADHVVSLLLGNIKAYVVSTELIREPVVHMRFTYHDEDDLKMLLEALNDDNSYTGIVFLTFVYLHEVQHIVRKHTTSAFNEILLKTAQLVNSKYQEYKEIHEEANFAEDYCINYALYEIFMHEKGEFKKEFAAIAKQVLFNKDYKDDNETIVLTKLLKSKPDVTKISEDEHTVTFEIQEKDEQGNNKGQPKQVTIPKPNAIQQGNQTFEEENEINKGIDSIAESIQQHIDREKEKGDGSFLMGESIGNSIKTNTDWFDKLKSSFYSIVTKKTRNTTARWSNFNNKYRHSHKSPTHVNIENKLHLVWCVDNSGSMMTETLKKMLYILEEKYHKIESITLIRHTESITGVLENERSEKKILDFIGKRDNGGTSHREVFEWLDKNLKPEEAKKTVFISFSDNHSDIETQYFNYRNIQKMTKVWLNADGRPVDASIPGDKIDIH